MALVAMFLLLVRPITAYISLIGAPHPFVSRAATAFFGIRGVGTLLLPRVCAQSDDFPGAAADYRVGVRHRAGLDRPAWRGRHAGHAKARSDAHVGAASLARRRRSAPASPGSFCRK